MHAVRRASGARTTTASPGFAVWYRGVTLPSASPSDNPTGNGLCVRHVKAAVVGLAAAVLLTLTACTVARGLAQVSCSVRAEFRRKISRKCLTGFQSTSRARSIQFTYIA